MPNFKPYIDDEGNEINAMIYVSSNFANSENPDLIKNLQLCSTNKCTVETKRNPETNEYSTLSTVYEHGIETGIYVDGSSNVNFENIKIMDTKRGVYVSADSHDILMDNIHMSKTRVNGVSLLDFPTSENDEVSEKVSAEIANNYSNSKNVGIDCYAVDCHFSNIVVIDYLIGMRVGGGDNYIYGAHIWNTYCPEQYKYSVGFINGSTVNYKSNTYYACVADKFHIGWLSSDTSPFSLINCHWLNKQVEIDINGDDIDEIYGNEAYGFFIPDGVVCSSGKIGTNINVIDCYMVGSDLDNDECFTNFCNRKDHSIGYAGTTSNVFYAPNKDVTYGRIKSVDEIIENSEDERFNVYRLTPNDIASTTNSTFTENSYIDNIVSATGEIGTISNCYPTTTEVVVDNDEVEFIINANDDYTAGDYISMDLSKLGYINGDVGVICFDYYTEAVGSDYRHKEVSLNSSSINDYFTETGVSSIPLEASSNNIYKTLTYMFKIKDATSDMFVDIGFGELIGSLNESNTTGTDFRKAISIKDLRIIKIPSEWCIPKYYLETEEKYKERVLKFFANSEYANGVELPNCSDKELAFVSLPFKYEIDDLSENHPNNRYALKYSKLGRPCLKKIGNDNKNSFKEAIRLTYNIGNANRLFGTKGYKYVNSSDKSAEFKYGFNTHPDSGPWINTLIHRDNTLFSYDFTEGVSIYDTTFFLPNLEADDIFMVDIINNPFGYHFESPVVAEYDTENEPIEVDIPLYTNGEVRVIMKNETYTTDLPTVFYVVNHSESQESSS